MMVRQQQCYGGGIIGVRAGVAQSESGGSTNVRMR